MILYLVVLLFLSSIVVGNESTCHNPRVRKEWRDLKNHEKLDYLNAVKCLFSKPSRLSAPYVTKNRYDDFVALHIWATTAPANDSANYYVSGPGIHFNGVFLPWHRYTLWIFENALRDECHYTGAQPYWDWSLDVAEGGGSFNTSPVFDSVYGFGGNGINGSTPDGGPPDGFVPYLEPSGSCIYDGPFAKLPNRTLGWGYNLNVSNPHYLKRNFQLPLADTCLGWKTNVWPMLKATNFTRFTNVMGHAPIYVPADIENACSFGTHAAGHGAVGGEMSNTWSSVNDPTFFLHHGQLDRLWALWQSLRSEYLYSIGGSVWVNGTGTITLDYPVKMLDSVAPTIPIRQLMDTVNKNGKGLLCYVYEENGQPLP